MAVLKKIIKNALFLASASGNYLVCLPVFRLFARRFPRISSSDTELCIEGFPRSGNTYFVSAFLGWNRGVTVAHHSHLAGSAKYSIRRGIPTVILIREPQDAAASVMAWDGLLWAPVALLSYIHFYRVLWKYRKRFLVLSFDDVTQHPDDCVHKINRRFGRSFNCEEFSTLVDESIRARIKTVDLRHDRDGTNSSLPNQQKLDLKTEYSRRARASWLYPVAHSLYFNLSALRMVNVNREGNKATKSGHPPL
jgi:hypothetical protein